jgi:hypothetical protein
MQCKQTQAYARTSTQAHTQTHTHTLTHTLTLSLARSLSHTHICTSTYKKAKIRGKYVLKTENTSSLIH